MEGTQGSFVTQTHATTHVSKIPTHLKVQGYREWTKGNVFHIEFRIDGRYWMNSVRSWYEKPFREKVLAMIEEYLIQKENKKKIAGVSNTIIPH